MRARMRSQQQRKISGKVHKGRRALLRFRAAHPLHNVACNNTLAVPGQGFPTLHRLGGQPRAAHTWMVLPLQLKMYTVCLGSVCSMTISRLPTCRKGRNEGRDTSRPLLTHKRCYGFYMVSPACPARQRCSLPTCAGRRLAASMLGQGQASEHAQSMLTWFSTTHLRPCSHSSRGGAAGLALAAAAAALPAAAAGAAGEGPAGTAPLRSPRFFVFMSSSERQAKGACQGAPGKGSMPGKT